MNSKEIDRKIAVIFATDVAGYSKLMEKDEEQTIKTIRACKEILENLFKEHGGRTFNTAGDSVLAEFSSAVSAVVCASEFQKLIKERNEKNSFKMHFRIGINMGDVVKEEEDLYGDGVNIAARLEALAQPDGISISKNVYDLVNKKAKFLFNDLGEQKVKDNQFHAFDVVLDPSQKRTIKPQSSSKIPLYTGIVAVLIIAIVFLFYFNNPSVQQEEVKTVSRDNLPIILVKPLNNIGSDDTSIADALTESMISSLSRYTGITVLSNSTSFGIQKKQLLDEEIKKDFNVSFIFQGSIQSFGENTRLIVELNDLSKNKVVWSDRFDFKLDDIFKIQDEIGNKVLGELHINAVMGQYAKKLKSEFDTFDQYLLYTNFHSLWNKYNRENFENMIGIRDQLISLNTDKNVINELEAWLLHQSIMIGYTENKEKDLKRLDLLTNQNIQNRGNAMDYRLRAIVELEYFSKDCAIAKPLILKAVHMEGGPFDYLAAGYIHKHCGDYLKSIEFFKETLRQSPSDDGYMARRMYAASLYTLGKEEEIRELIGDAINNKDMFGMVLWYYAAMEVETGNIDKAKEYFDRGKENGARGKWIYINLGNSEATEKLTKLLEPLGSLD